MIRIKRILNKHFPRAYATLAQGKHEIRVLKHRYRSRRETSLKVANTEVSNHDAHYEQYPDLDRRVADLGYLGVFSAALAPAAEGLGKECDPQHVVMLVVSALRIDPRVEREARALAESGYRVTIICPDISTPPLRENPIDWGSNIEFEILDWQAASYINQYPWLHGEMMLEAALKYHPLAFHCHDLSTSLIGLTAARKTGAKCVCDFHEWYSENVSWDPVKQVYVAHPDSTRKIYQAAEALAMARADEVITVCHSIANELQTGFHRPFKPVHVIRNVPSLKRSGAEYQSLREMLGVGTEQFILLWQGGTGPTRLLEPVIESLAFAPNVVFVVRGPSLDLFGDGYKELARRAGVQERLHLLPPVKSADVVAASKGADVGIWTLPNLSKNFYYALPNKIFEYLAAGLPLVCANFPEARSIIERYRVGLTFDPYDPQSIASALERLSDPVFRSECASNISSALDELQAGQEWDKLVRLYDGFGHARDAMIGLQAG